MRARAIIRTMKSKKKEDWGWDSGLLRHRVMKSLGIAETPYTKTKNLIQVLDDASDQLDHLPFRISDVVLVTDKIPVMAELLSHPTRSTFWEKITQSDNLFMFCDPYRDVSNSVLIAASKPWFGPTPAFSQERKTLTAQIISYNKRLNLSAYACLF